MDKLRELQLKTLEIILEVDRICKKNNIEYFLGFGTALGAVRHKGFIPWDDDADLMMKYDEWIKFKKACDKDLNKDKFTLQTFDDKPKVTLWNKVRMENTCSAPKDMINYDFNWGICIDIFVLVLKKKNNFLLSNIYKKYILASLDSRYVKDNHKNVFKRLIYKIIYFMYNEKFLNLLYKKLYKDDKNADTYICIEFSSFYKRNYPRELFDDIIEIDFEGKKFPIMKDYDKYLKICYGDYMKLPPKEERLGHGDIIIDVNKSYKFYQKK